MKLFGFLITILIAGILFGFGAMIKFFKAIFGIETKSSHAKRHDNNEQISRNKQDLSHKKPKVFSKEEGEYTNFEEV